MVLLTTVGKLFIIPSDNRRRIAPIKANLGKPRDAKPRVYGALCTMTAGLPKGKESTVDARAVHVIWLPSEGSFFIGESTS